MGSPMNSWSSPCGTIKLYCGDSSSLDSMLWCHADAVVTDPPYGVMLGEHGKSGQEKRKKQAKYTQFSDTPDYVRDICVPIIQRCIDQVGRVVMTPGNRNWNLYPKPNDIGGMHVPAATSRGPWGFVTFNPIFYYGKSPRAGRGDFPSGFTMNEASYDKSHPCAKPLAAMEWLVKKATLEEGETVFDPFMGAGTSAVACYHLRRRYVGCEIEPDYFSLAVDNIQQEIEYYALLEASQNSLLD